MPRLSSVLSLRRYGCREFAPALRFLGADTASLWRDGNCRLWLGDVPLARVERNAVVADVDLRRAPALQSRSAAARSGGSSEYAQARSQDAAQRLRVWSSLVMLISVGVLMLLPVKRRDWLDAVSYGHRCGDLFKLLAARGRFSTQRRAAFENVLCTDDRNSGCFRIAVAAWLWEMERRDFPSRRYGVGCCSSETCYCATCGISPVTAPAG